MIQPPEQSLDWMLDDLAASATPLAPELRRRLAATLPSVLEPTSPLPARGVLWAGLVAMAAAVAFAAAARAGLHGWSALDVWERALIFPVLLLLLGLAASGLVREVIPGSPRHLGTGWRLAAIWVIALALFALLFRQYGTDNFVRSGIACLSAGLAWSLLVAALGWWWLRRAFALRPAMAGLAAGSWAGLAGLGMLELHCPNLQAPHVLVWHVAVVPIAAGFAMLAAHLVRPRT